MIPGVEEVARSTKKSAAHVHDQEGPLNKLSLAVGSAVLFLLASCATAPEPAPQPAPPSLPVSPPPQREVAPPPPPPPPPVAAPKRCDAAVTFQNEEVFAFSKSELTQAAKARLDRDVVARLASCARLEAVVVEGHTDRMGSHPYNQKLSERRAESVKAYLVGKSVDPDKIETLGMGKTVPAKFCPGIEKRSELIACLAPSRRAIVSIKGTGR
jgi:outer membrane protein OmpA-like peptidoglycan-associated protein